MTSRVLAVALLLLLGAGEGLAHVGSPDVFYDGMVGPYAARVTIRMPSVVPGRAEIAVRVQTEEPVEVFFLPLYSSTAITNAPPPDAGRLITGETNLYSGDLWLMSFGSYSIEVRLRGKAGDGKVEIPVNSVAIRQLPMPALLGKILLMLGAVLVFGGLAIVAAAARESVLPTGVSPGRLERRRGGKAWGMTAMVFALALVGGAKWWKAEESTFRKNLREGTWPDMTAEARVEGPQRILRLELGKKDLGEVHLPLIPDHGKLLHLFLIRQPGNDAMGHLHPVRTGKQTFEVALPALPEGDYRVLCDLTMEGSALSSTATATARIPAIPAQTAGAVSREPDPDDSWAGLQVQAAAAVSTGDTICRLPGGQQVIWKAHGPLRVKQDAALRFEARDAADQPLELEPYMGMMCHAAVFRKDGGVFAHLHPAGNFSMAAQSFFDAKMEKETRKQDAGAMPAAMDHSKMHHHHASGAEAVVSLPYEFPTAGQYRIWVQFKSGGEVLTGVFDAAVQGE